MTPERWQEVEKVLEAARELAPMERGAFLDQVCARDQELRREVESLLFHQQQAGSFIETPAVDLNHDELEKSAQNSLAGQEVGHYQVLQPIGRGGMGVVYLAQDIRLHRRVALKLLPAEFVKNKDRLHRFEQEARAASGLNHPNILTIHDIGQTAHGYFIATEFIDGITLRQRLNDSPLELKEALDIAIQVASALASAHQAGIVHRDIKPENIMLRRDGYIKVLDFGLAKLIETEQPTTSGEAATLRMVQTETGVVMGTATYMSPEQARGKDVDARTDIWSLGVVLYEMVAGRSPFEGETMSYVIAAILKTEPLSLTSLEPETPAELQRICRKAVRKKREERYQTVLDMAVDLKTLKRDLEFASELEISSRPPLSSSKQSRPLTYGAKLGIAASTGNEPPARPTSSAEYLLSETKQHPGGATLLLIGVAIAGLAAALGIYRLTWRNERTPLLNEKMTISRLTTTGIIRAATISRDGKYVAYTTDDQSLWIRHVASSNNIQIGPPLKDGELFGLTFSADGNYLYFGKNEFGKLVPSLYQVSTLGGAPRTILANVHSAITFSPDNRKFAFERFQLENSESQIVIANADGSNEQILAKRINPEWFGGSGISWSPDGKTISVIAGDKSFQQYIIHLRVDDGAQVPLKSEKWGDVRDIAWLSDGSGLLIAANEPDQRGFSVLPRWPEVQSLQLWLASYPGGEVHRITNDLNSYLHVSVTSDSQTLVAPSVNLVSNIWVFQNLDVNHGRQISLGNNDGYNGLSWARDNSIAYSSNATGHWQIWKANDDGTGQKQLTDNSKGGSNPYVTPDGRYVVFSSPDTEGIIHIWRMDIDGSNLKQLTFGNGESADGLSLDGLWVVYSGLYPGGTTFPWYVGKVPLEGGESVRIKENAFGASVSPDGKLIVCGYLDPKMNPQIGAAILPFEGGEVIHRFNNFAFARWSPDGRALTYADRGKLWSQPIAGGAPKELIDLGSDDITWFDWSKDGKRLAVARGHQSTDIVLISNFR